MKKLTIDPRFWLTAAFCAALLAAPPLLTQGPAGRHHGPHPPCRSRCNDR